MCVCVCVCIKLHILHHLKLNNINKGVEQTSEVDAVVITFSVKHKKQVLVTAEEVKVK